MGACNSVEVQADRARSDAIDSQLLEEARKFKKEAKVRVHAPYLSSYQLEFSSLCLERFFYWAVARVANLLSSSK